MTTYFDGTSFDGTSAPAPAPELDLVPPAVLDQSNLVDPVKAPPR